MGLATQQLANITLCLQATTANLQLHVVVYSYIIHFITELSSSFTFHFCVSSSSKTLTMWSLLQYSVLV